MACHSYPFPCAPMRRGAAAVALLLAGCASNELDAQWTDPQFQGRLLRGDTILVVCEAPDPVLKRACQDQLAAEVTAFGAAPRIAPELPNPTPGREQAPRAYLAAAREAGAQAVFSAAVVTDALPARQTGSSIGIGMGGFGSGRIGVGGGIGISLPIGGGGPAYQHGLSGALTDVASGRLMWSGTVRGAAAGSGSEQVSALARAVAEGAHKAGFF